MRGLALAGLLLAGCSAAPLPDGETGSRSAAAAADNIAAPGPDLPWSYVNPDRRFDPGSTANRLRRPAFLRGARLGYFADPGITRQYSARQRATMRADHAGFVARRDLDRDGVPETYRTGYWRRGDEEGTFLAVFVGGGQRDLIDTTEQDGVFMAQDHGSLVIANCNCPYDGVVSFTGGRLHVRSRGDARPQGTARAVANVS